MFTRESTTVTYTVRIEGAEPLPTSAHRLSIRFRPTHAEVTFTDGRSPRVELSGPSVKKDGSDGGNFHKVDMGLRESQSRPDWYGALIKKLQPFADAAFR